MGFKVASRVRGLSDEAFREAFGAEEQCRSALSRLRWPDLALWLSSTSELGGLRKAKTRALAEMYKETGIGVASHQVDVFVLAPGTDSYLGRLCDFARCPKHKPECLVPGCGAVAFLQQHDGFVFDPEALAPDRVIRLFDRQSGLLRKAAEVPLPEREEDEDGAMA